MASVRGILKIQSLIELSSENLFYIRGLHARIDHTRRSLASFVTLLRMWIVAWIAC